MPYCPKCGKEVKEDDKNCPNCGRDLKAHVIYRRHDDSRDDWEVRVERWAESFDPGKETQAGKIVGGFIVLWLGLSFLLAEWNILAWGSWWAWFLTGIGVILIGRGVFSWTQGGFRESAKGHIIGGVVVGSIGIANLVNIHNWWAMIIVVVGLVIIASGLTKRF